MPSRSTYSRAAARPTASAMLGVPASNFAGGSENVLCSKVTVRIMDPPPCQGGIFSRSALRA